MGKFSFSDPPPLKTRTVKVPEWDPDEEFTIRELTALEAQDFKKRMQNYKNGPDAQVHCLEVYAFLVAASLTAPDGSKPTEDWLMSSNPKALNRLGETILEFNGLSEKAEKKLEKNLQKGDADSLSSGSPSDIPTQT